MRRGCCACPFTSYAEQDDVFLLHVWNYRKISKPPYKNQAIPKGCRSINELQVHIAVFFSLLLEGIKVFICLSAEQGLVSVIGSVQQFSRYVRLFKNIAFWRFIRTVCLWLGQAASMKKKGVCQSEIGSYFFSLEFFFIIYSFKFNMYKRFFILLMGPCYNHGGLSC